VTAGCERCTAQGSGRIGAQRDVTSIVLTYSHCDSRARTHYVLVLYLTPRPSFEIYQNDVLFRFQSCPPLPRPWRTYTPTFVHAPASTAFASSLPRLSPPPSRHPCPRPLSPPPLLYAGPAASAAAAATASVALSSLAAPYRRGTSSACLVCHVSCGAVLRPLRP